MIHSSVEAGRRNIITFEKFLSKEHVSANILVRKMLASNTGYSCFWFFPLSQVVRGGYYLVSHADHLPAAAYSFCYIIQRRWEEMMNTRVKCDHITKLRLTNNEQKSEKKRSTTLNQGDMAISITSPLVSRFRSLLVDSAPPRSTWRTI